MVVVIDVEPIRERFLTVAPFLDERGRRLVAAAEAFAAGYGGIAAVAMATGMAPSTIGRGLSRPSGFGGRGRGASRRFARACPREGGGPDLARGSRGAGRTPGLRRG